MAEQLTDTILMVPPDTFRYNSDTTGSNSFQNEFKGNTEELQKKVKEEFDNMTDTLRQEGVNVLIYNQPKDKNLPDAVFPNNWFATDSNDILYCFPLLSQTRRDERDNETISNFLLSSGYNITMLADLTECEKEEIFLEGTGSMVIDRKNDKIYTSESPRTNLDAIKSFAEFAYIPDENIFTFKSYDRNSQLIYHTNVMMSIGDGFAVVCKECVDKDNQERIVKELSKDSEVIEITSEQMYSFCGNILHLKTRQGKKIIVMSEKAFQTFTTSQLSQLEKYGKIVPVNIDTIETVGGGSARCMIAEIFLHKN